MAYNILLHIYSLQTLHIALDPEILLLGIYLKEKYVGEWVEEMIKREPRNKVNAELIIILKN